MKIISLFALMICLCTSLNAQEPSFTWLLDKMYCDSIECFQARALEKDFAYSETSQTDNSIAWFFEANKSSRVTSANKVHLESPNRLFFKMGTDGTVTIVIATEDGGYYRKLQQEIVDKGFKEVSIGRVDDDPDHIRTVYSSPDGYSLYDVSTEFKSVVRDDGNRISTNIVIITKWRKGRK
jgi:hypothetical protein